MFSSSKSGAAVQQLLVLGATGSVGRSTLDVAARHPDKIAVWGLSAHRDWQGILALANLHRPRVVAMACPDAAAALQAALADAQIACEVLAGNDALDQLAADPEVDQVMCAVAGSPGLPSTLAALRAGKRVLIANKEPLVMAGALMMAEARRCGATVLPIDSEHNAIFQSLPGDSRCGHPLPKGIVRLILTASGGPFRTAPLADFAHITPAQAVKHPNWSMGRKISVDSATMMNKGLELIEAGVLYGLPESRIDVVIHPESLIHSMVEYVDGSVLSQMGAPDMRVPIAHALAWPERWESGVGGLDWSSPRSLQFSPMDDARFPALGLARSAMRAGGHAPNVLNAANEVAVDAFLAGGLGFTGIAEIVEQCLQDLSAAPQGRANELEDILMVAAWARTRANSLIAARA